MTTIPPDPERGETIGSPPAPPPGAAGGELHPPSPAIPVTTDRRTPATRIQANDHVRHLDGLREGVVEATDGFIATVHWSDGTTAQELWGYLERVPPAVATP